MTYENTAGLSVANQYGPRDTGNTAGVEHSTDSIHQLSITLTGRMLSETPIFIPKIVAKKGTLFRRALLRVDEAFGLTGTTPSIEVGSEGSTATNGFVITETELETIGTKALTSVGVGTWAIASTTGVAVDADVAVAKEGDTVVDPLIGKATLILEYFYKTKV